MLTLWFHLACWSEAPKEATPAPSPPAQQEPPPAHQEPTPAPITAPQAEPAAAAAAPRPLVDVIGRTWTVVPRDAKDLHIESSDGQLRVKVTAPSADHQVCSEPVPRAALSTARASGTTVATNGAPVRFHVRGLDDRGRLVERASGRNDIERLGPIRATGAFTVHGDLDLHPTARNVRLCLVLAGFVGEVHLASVGLD